MWTMTEGSPKWWHRKILNSPPPTDTKIYSTWNNFCKKKKWKPDKQHLHNKKLKGHIEMSGRDRDIVSLIASPQAQWPTIGRDCKNIELFSGEQKICAPYQGSQPLNPAPETWATKTSGCEANGHYICKNHRITGNREPNRKGLMCRLTCLRT